jgi:hypothetical protein
MITQKLANALIADAEPTAIANALAGGGLILKGFKRQFGGVWVGGTVTLTEDELSFAPNALNRAVHVSVASTTIPLGSVARASDRFGWFTRIIDVVQTDGSVFTFRCYGAKAFGEKIRAAAEALKAHAR